MNDYLNKETSSDTKQNLVIRSVRLKINSSVNVNSQVAFTCPDLEFSQTNVLYSMAKLGALSLTSSTETRTTAFPTLDGSTDRDTHLSSTLFHDRTNRT